ncbi:MAG: hypothetical protein Q4A96_00760 [Candidatus Saccharibacteria bacterium]|nr:hypothetical protein [Candidatus Saccharibacteria bacterium]
MKHSLSGVLKRFLKANKWAIIGIAALTGFFALSLKVVVPFDTDSFYGQHSWLSGSTIKFVNNWLEEGAANLNFTSYEFPKSIEHTAIEDRGAYLSYPTGEVFFVYIFAKATGHSQIDISFLRKFQAVWFWFEAVLIFVFVWLFMRRTIRSDHKIENALFAFCTSAMWILMPTCTYYLANVYFADQCVILWVIAYVLANYVRWTSKNKRIPSIACVLLLFSGILIDYYFWILAFFVFVYDLVVAIKNAKSKEKLKASVKTILFHGIPTVLALIVFYLQLSQTNDWLSVMMLKAKVRTSSDGIGKSSIRMVLDNIAHAFAFSPELIVFLAALVVFAIFLFAKLIVSKEKRKKYLSNNPGFAVFVIYFVATATQLLVLRNHSGVHEFSMIKIAWIVTMLPLFIATCLKYLSKQDTTDKEVELFKKIKLSHFGISFGIVAILVVFATGIPFSTKNFYKSRWSVDKIDYSIAWVLAQETKYEDVVFSYTHSIPDNPPQELSVSKKVVYEISELKEMKTLFPNLPAEAKRLLLVEKNSDESEKELEKSQLKSIECAEKNGTIRFENDEIILLEIAQDSSCLAN